MHINRHGLMTGAAVLAALGIGFAGAQFIDRPTAATEAEHADDNHEDEGGSPIVVLSPQAAERAGVTVVGVERGGGSELKLPGRVAFAPGAEASIDSPLAGGVVRVHVGPGDRVSVGSPIATLRSTEGAGSRATVDAAAASAQAAVAAERRDRQLFEQGWIAQARLDITTAEARRAEAELRAARARVGVYGTPGTDGSVVVRSPLAGIVTHISAAPGQFLHEEAPQIATVADVRRVELVFDAPPSAAAVLRIGDRLEIAVPGAEPATGVISAIAPVNAEGVVIVRATPTGSLPPAGTVLSARILSSGPGPGLTVPADAVQTVEGQPSVFVVEGAGFRARPVVTGRTAGGRVEIVSGLTGAERIAGQGAFLLKAELAKGDAEHGH
ncbi:efflux RND transporter periplasmic adaptor subunit [Brevundimonas vitis]|uniref:Efflux RND transporter periplasmic adaptor subunit n=2 Tax=Brevundimonas vitisensis TaxID=2800818 RepID=A0ABX7BT48_9CAUL|nr:efflux RND transporter periplasmic adaptor subunit [Brevundimonas vitisensis]